MDRTFQHRFTIGAKSGIIILSLLAFYLFWEKGIIPALIVVVMLVAVIERVLHSCYIVRDHDLVIHRGRFLHDITVPLRAIRSIRSMTTTWGLVHFLLIEYGNGQLVSVEACDEHSFLGYLRKHIHNEHLTGNEEKDAID